MTDIKKYIRTNLQQAGLSEKDLERPGAHVMVADGDDNLHVLVKKSEAAQGIESLAAEIRGTRVKLGVAEAEPLDLGELGEWRDFVISGLDDDKLRAAPNKNLELHIYSKSVAGEALGERFHTSVDLAFAMFEVLGAGQLAVRPVPPGEREGKTYVEVDAKLRKVLHQMLGRWVDSAVPAETMLKAAERWRSLQDEVYSSGLIGALTLGLAPDRPPLPLPDLPAPKKEADGLSGDLRAYLGQVNLPLPEGAPTAEWAEATLDRLPNDVPEGFALALRNLYGQLLEAKDKEVDDLFGDVVAQAPKEIVHQGDRAVGESRRMKAQQLEQVTQGLGVEPMELTKLADQMASALASKKKPSLVIIAGPRHSAADRLQDAAVEMVGKKPLTIGREDVFEPGFPGLYGQHRGFPTDADAILSPARLSQHRDTPAAHTPILIENLAAAGGAVPDDQDAARRDLLERLLEMGRSGNVNTYYREGRGRPEQREVPLANTVFVARWEGDPAQLERLLRDSPALAHLADKVVKADALAPQAGVRFLKESLEFQVRQHFGPKVQLRFSNELEASLRKAYQKLGSELGYERFSEQLFTELMDALKAVPAGKVELGWSRMLTPKERDKLTAGEPITFAARWFAVREGE